MVNSGVTAFQCIDPALILRSPRSRSEGGRLEGHPSRVYPRWALLMRKSGKPDLRGGRCGAACACCPWFETHAFAMRRRAPHHEGVGREGQRLISPTTMRLAGLTTRILSFVFTYL